MCDTFVVPCRQTLDQVAIFAKNSDRQRNEAQSVEYFSSTEHQQGEQVTCTYLTIPQHRHTYAVLLCRPFWMWGAEMGANEHGVAIGNESLFSRIPSPEIPALTGMDLLRLALERGATATEALEVITSLLEKYGQGGDCGHMVPYYYNNGFLIADADEAYVLETVGREWFAERVQGIRTISNCYSVDYLVDQTSAGLQQLLQTCSWNSTDPPNYSQIVADRTREDKGQAHSRRARADSLLRQVKGGITVPHATAVLRDHGPTTGWSPQEALPFGLCVHAGSDDRSAQTTGAMVSELRHRDSVHWVTGTAAPCISIFKPVLIDVPLPFRQSALDGTYNPGVLWWQHEKLHRRALLGDFPKFLEAIRRERDALEEDFRARVTLVLEENNAELRSQVIAKCWKDAEEMENRWLVQLNSVAAEGNPRYRGSWHKMNLVAGLDTDSRKR